MWRCPSDLGYNTFERSRGKAEEMKNSESGLEELLRLSRETSKAGQKLARREQQHSEKTQVVRGLREIKVSVALDQLKLFAKPGITEQVRSLKNKKTNEDLRRLILDLTSELERSVTSTSAPTVKASLFERQVKTLAVLVELLFSLE